MEWIRGYFQRKQDQSSVSYARFGRPGEEQEERPPPTQIVVAPFDEDAPQFKLFGFWHIEKASASLSVFGISMVIIFFISTFFEFNWYHYRKGVDISALFGLFTYLALGVLIHYYVIYGIKKQTAYYLLPFIVVYSVVLTGEGVGLILLIIKMAETKEPTHPPFFGMFMVVSITITVQTFMLLTIVRCREYLSLKENHALEVRIAERGKSQNPGMEIVVAGRSPTMNDENQSENIQSSLNQNEQVNSVDNPVFGV